MLASATTSLTVQQSKSLIYNATNKITGASFGTENPHLQQSQIRMVLSILLHFALTFPPKRAVWLYRTRAKIFRFTVPDTEFELERNTE